MHFRFIHAADLHLDSPFRGLTHLPEPVLQEVRASTFRAFEALIDLCIEKETDFLLVAGDVYDLADRSLYAQVAFQQGLERLHRAGIAAYVIHGNHDPMDGGQASLRWPKSVHFFSAESVEGVSFYKEGQEAARIYGRSYPTTAFASRIVQDYLREPGVAFAIGLLHTNVDGDPNHEAYAPSTTTELLAQEMDYWALGHIHRGGILHREPWIVYAGNLQGRSVKETGEKGCYLVEVAENQVQEVRFYPLQQVVWADVKVALDGIASEQGVLEAVTERLEEVQASAGGMPLIARVNLVGETPLHRMLKEPYRVQDWRETLQDGLLAQPVWIWLESFRVKTRDPVDREVRRGAEDFLGELLRMLEKTRQDPEARQELEKVVQPLFSHRTVKKYLPPLEEEDWAWWLDEVEDRLILLLEEDQWEGEGPA